MKSSDQPKPLRFTRHAQTVMQERDLSLAWVEASFRSPEWEEPNHRPGVRRRFRAIPEQGGPVLRVACVETDTEIRILSAFLDRRARRPQ